MDRWDGKKVTNWGKYVGLRCIVVRDSPVGGAIEVKVLEVSPKGRVKFEYPTGYKGWEDREEYLLIEVLNGNQGGKE